jgi:hypothetical protein
MAVPNILLVSNAGYAAANGTYTRVADFGGYPAWEQAGGTVGIRTATGGPNVFWQITGLPYVGGGPTCNIIYSSNFNIPGANWPGEYPGDPAADPVTWGNDCLGTGNAPVVSAPAPDPYAPWGGFANWQRLRLLEYV